MPWVKVDGWCTSATCPGITPIYNPNLSSTFSDITTTSYGIGYGSGSMKGKFSKDNFCFDTSQAGACFST
jgi:hypothetical protein